MDDGSDDSSWSILGDYALRDPRVRRFSQSNAGPASARNRGLKEMIGDYVLFVDSDDWIEPEMFELLFVRKRAEQLAKNLKCI